jgi:hypothetical protein
MRAVTVLASDSPSWGVLAGALVIVVVTHWLLPRVVFPWIAGKRPNPLENQSPRRWALIAVAGLATYVALGLVFGMSAPTLLIWGIAYVAAMAVLYRRATR